MSMSKDIEKAVDAIEDMVVIIFSPGKQEDGRTLFNRQITRKAIEKVLQSQADKYQKEKGEVMRLVHKIIFDEESKMYFEQLAEKYGVDLSE